jgi:hypothetical protein
MIVYFVLLLFYLCYFFTFREYNAMKKHVARHRGRDEKELAKSLSEQFQTYKLDHIIKER